MVQFHLFEYMHKLGNRPIAITTYKFTTNFPAQSLSWQQILMAQQEQWQ